MNIRLALLGVALIGVSAAALAQTNAPPLNLAGLPGTYTCPPIRGVMVPPAIFDHPSRNAIVREVPCESIPIICNNVSAISCALIPEHGGDWCVIYIPTKMEKWQSDLVTRHEMGHCNSGSTAHNGYYLPAGL